MPTPMAAAEVLDREFLQVRARLIDVAATLDRIDRAEDPVADDRRLERIRQAARILAGDASGRAEKLQLLFSLPHRDDWRTDYGL